MSKRKQQIQKKQETAKKVKRRNIIDEHNDSEDMPELVSHGHSGKILKINLKNFMCHNNLTVEFNQNANFLIGKNGSGKSAVLTALMIGLGGNANLTNRSSSIKQLIENGEPSATIEIHLSNDGFNHYESKIYGDKIVVVRQIAASGSSTYKLKSSRGEIISNKRDDLRRMLLYMNIQIDNPFCVLTQDTARNFLTVYSNPGKLYALFLKAMQLDSILEKFDSVEAQLISLQETIIARGKHSTELKIKYEDAEILISKLDSIDKIKRKISQLKCAKKWCAVANEEALVQEITNTLEEVNAKKEELLRKTQNRENDEEQLNARLAHINGSIDELMQTSNEHLQRYEAQKVSRREANDRMAEKTRDVKQIEGKKDRIVRDIQKLEEHISNDANKEIVQLKGEHKRKIAELQSSNAEIQKTITTINQNIKKMDKDVRHEKAQIEDLESKLKVIDKNIDYTNRQLRRLTQNTPINSLQLYGEFMPSLVNDINRLHADGKFTEKPIGPIGDMIEVIVPKYRNLIENCCKNLLHTFLVNDVSDLMVLKQHLRTNYPQAKAISTIVMKFRDTIYDVRGNRVAKDSRFVVLMDAVKIDNPNVMNCFIDHIKADTTVFVNKFDDVTKLTDKIENVPPNLSKVLLLEPCSEFFPAPTYRSYSINLTTARFLRVASNKSEAYYTHELEKLEGNKASIEKNCSQLKTALTASRFVLDQEVELLDKLENDILVVTKRSIFALETYEYPEETEIVVMTREIEAQKKILAETEANLTAATTQKRALKNEVNLIETQIKEICQAMKSLDEEKLKRQKEKDDMQEKIHKFASNAKAAQTSLQTCNSQATTLTVELNAANENLANAVAIAQGAGDRPNPIPEFKLDKMINVQEMKIKKINSSSSSTASTSMEEARRIFEKFKKDYEEHEKFSTSLTDTFNNLNEATLKRSENIETYMKSMTNRTSHYFKTLMALRDFNGKLQFDHEKQTLVLDVITRDKSQVNATSGTKLLSGGERSYTMNILLRSLWMCMDHPFYFLDEYDIFTDQVIRKYITDILLKQSETHPDSQYTFLTPQDVSDMTVSNKLSIIRRLSTQNFMDVMNLYLTQAVNKSTAEDLINKVVEDSKKASLTRQQSGK